MKKNLSIIGLVLVLSLVLLVTSVTLTKARQNLKSIAVGDDLPIYIGKSMSKG
jgi:hypothetical protein